MKLVVGSGVCRRLLSLALLVILGGGGCAPPSPTALPSPTPTPTQTPTPLPTPSFTSPEPTRLPSPGYGVNVHMWWDRWAAQHTWQLVMEAGFGWVKQRLAWRDVQPLGPGEYDWSIADQIVQEAEDREISLVFRLDKPPEWALKGGGLFEGGDDSPGLKALGTFCAAAAERYRGRVRGYQVWNEPNLAREWGGGVPDPHAYAALLRTCAVAVKGADPGALVISAGLAPTGSGPPVALPDVDFLEGMYAAGAAPYFDLLGLHAPGYAAPPEVSPAEVAATPEYGGFPFFAFRHVEEMREIMVRHGDEDKQVAILEFGWTTDPIHPEYAWFAVTPEEQADYLVRAFAYAREHWSPWVGPMFVWNLPDSHWTPEQEEFWWAIVDPFHWEEGGTRPAYEALVEMEKE